MQTLVQGIKRHTVAVVGFLLLLTLIKFSRSGGDSVVVVKVIVVVTLVDCVLLELVIL